jgi:hypothetical protein
MRSTLASPVGYQHLADALAVPPRRATAARRGGPGRPRRPPAPRTFPPPLRPGLPSGGLGLPQPAHQPSPGERDPRRRRTGSPRFGRHPAGQRRLAAGTGGIPPRLPGQPWGVLLQWPYSHACRPRRRHGRRLRGGAPGPFRCRPREARDQVAARTCPARRDGQFHASAVCVLRTVYWAAQELSG